MTNKEKIVILEDMLELETGSLTLETELKNIKEYDSMAKLSLIVLFDEEYSEQIRGFKTIGDIVNAMK